ncbi:ATP-binding protein [Sphingomonas crusticola]|uniref:ATP-binding protein n=1 Tax=Sphingomonas crusticola TaxID=1697973 RepID=UPI000E24DBF2|nr:ATP-binding protein [Sphingomonas crusticola]
MDKPVLALTRRGSAGASGRPLQSVVSENMRQLIQLRWIAVGGQLLTILAVNLGLGVSLPLVPMIVLVALLAFANLVSIILLPRHNITNVEIMVALLLDMAVLTAQLHLSGGATNPFISLYLLQVVLGAILLEVWSVGVLVFAACLCYAWLAAHSVPLHYPPRLLSEIGDLYRLGGWISFALTGTLLALFITRITRNLRARDRYLADLREHAAEEDGIVRMGLFASGAAHELGTPLASLAVILSDWRRMPVLADHPELSADLVEMQAEVQRCKEIVSDILQSAGEPRGDDMANVAVPAFLEETVAAWRQAHPGVPLNFAARGLDDAAVVVSASLRQAIGNLLDNAAEVSSEGIGLDARREGEELILSVTDRGPGFTSAQLPMIGKPYQSSKGAGHGLGLFLAANVARRLGGRLEAANRAGGGAEVRLALPLVWDLARDE